MFDSDDLQAVFHKTEIIRRPTYGIVRGYHELPYICLGESNEAGKQTIEVRGRVHVSPRFLILPRDYGASYDDVFGEDNVDVKLMGRSFGFLGLRGRPVEFKSGPLTISHSTTSMGAALSNVLDELERQEDITTGVIVTPNSRYYPVSVERFITSVLDDEFSV